MKCPQSGPERFLFRITLSLIGIHYDSMTTAEKRIATIVVEAGFAEWSEKDVLGWKYEQEGIEIPCG